MDDKILFCLQLQAMDLTDFFSQKISKVKKSRKTRQETECNSPGGKSRSQIAHRARGKKQTGDPGRALRDNGFFPLKSRSAFSRSGPRRDHVRTGLSLYEFQDPETWLGRELVRSRLFVPRSFTRRQRDTAAFSLRPLRKGCESFRRIARHPLFRPHAIAVANKV